MAPLPLAVHISDGVLTTPWLASGFAGMVLLMVPACYRVRDEEIPRISLLTAAFFVASLIHIRIGPTSAHLLLNGLIGVVLGRRAALAIPVGLFLQAVLLLHGGLSALGVNACVMTLPALAAGGLFHLLHRMASARHPWFRSGLVFCSALAWVLCLVFSISLLLSNRVTGIAPLDPEPAVRITFHPGILAASIAVALAAVWLERRAGGGPEFSLGLALGVFSVLATASLNAAALLWGGQEDWHSLVLLVFVAHLPVAALEGVVLGFTVSFLARVKPEMLGERRLAEDNWQTTPRPIPAVSTNGAASRGADSRSITLSLVFFLTVVAGLATPGTVHAHRLEAEYRILPDGRVQVESWFDLTGDSPQGASVQVFRPGGELFTEGKLDEKGLFSFEAQRAEDLRVVVSAGAGHRKELLIPKAYTMQDVEPPLPPIAAGQQPPEHSGFADRSTRVTIKDVLAGIGFLLGLAAFVLSIRNAHDLRRMKNP
jgi:cobalt/nickel transport system permease protein